MSEIHNDNPSASTVHSSWGVAIASYDGGSAANTISIKPGDKVFNLTVNPDDTDWILGTDVSGKTGYVPTNFVKRSASDGQAAAGSLPENWMINESSNGQTYYVNKLTNETQWVSCMQ